MTKPFTDLPVRSEAWFARENDCISYMRVQKHSICPECNSGKVISPMQTCAEPYVQQCLNCNYTAEVKEFMI